MPRHVIDLPQSYTADTLFSALSLAQHLQRYRVDPEDRDAGAALVTLAQACYRGLGGEVPAGESPYRLERY